MENNTLAGFGIGLVSGVIIGGVIALLFAPQSGKKTRQIIVDKATEYVDEIVDTVKTVKEETSGVIDEVKTVAAEVGRKGEAAVKSLKN